MFSGVAIGEITSDTQFKQRALVKDDKDKVLLEIPATVGVIGAVIAPWLAALGVIATLATRCKMVVERKQ